ncbi:MAG: S4 domain-containing protein, partial [Gaiellales bacterium]
MAAAGLRLDRFLAEQSAVGSRAAAERLVAGGEVLVDGVARPKSHRLGGGEEVRFEPPEAAPELEAEAEPAGLHIAWEDEHLLVVDKPAGLVVHPSAGHGSGTLVNALLGRARDRGE